MNHMKVGVEIAQGRVRIFCLEQPQQGIEVDQALFDAVRLTTNTPERKVYEGYVVAIHGLPLEVASTLPLGMQRSLGVATQINPLARRKPGTTRYRASVGDKGAKKVHIP